MFMSKVPQRRHFHIRHPYYPRSENMGPYLRERSEEVLPFLAESETRDTKDLLHPGFERARPFELFTIVDCGLYVLLVLALTLTMRRIDIICGGISQFSLKVLPLGDQVSSQHI